MRAIDKAVKRGALHRNTGARKKSRAGRACAAAPPPDARRPLPRRARSARGAMTARTAAVSSSSAAAAAAAALELEVGQRLERAAQRLDVALPTRPRSAGRRRRAGIRRLFLICAAGSPASSGSAIASTSRSRRTMPKSRPGSRSPCCAQLESARVAACSSPATSASASVHDLALGRAGAGLLDLLGAEPRAGAVLQRELLELAQQPLLAVADVGDERPGAGLVELEAELARRARSPSAAARAA